MRARFQLELELRTTEVDSHLRARPVALLGMFQEAAVRQAEGLQRGPRWLRRQGMGWAIAHTRARFEHLPRWPALIRVTTWASELGSYLSRREFLLEDEDKRRLVSGSSLWAFIDIDKRRMIRIPRQVADAYRTDSRRALEQPFSRPRRPSQAAPGHQITISPQHIDFNGHVNNLALLDWMLLQQVEQEAWCLQELNVLYQREVLLGQVVEVSSEVVSRPEAGQLRLRHLVARPADGLASAVAESIWQPATAAQERFV